MTKKHKKIDLSRLKTFLPYLIAAAATLTVVCVGSLNKQNSDMSLSLDDFFTENTYKVSVDQLSELYVVADLADTLGLASASDVASNYVVTSSMYDAGQTSTGKIEKPSITNISTSRGIIEYIVLDGDTMDSIAAKYGLTTDQIRWSNGLKTKAISLGNKLLLPSVPGIVYTVKAGDTVNSIASRYGGSTAEIVALNDLEVSGLSEGMKIVIRNGVLPNTERPEYVAPAMRYFYTYLGSTSERQNIQVVANYPCRYGVNTITNMDGGANKYGCGQCTQWAWHNRKDLPSNLGNANTWARNAAARGYIVNRTPSAGAIFQTTSGWYGHVGYVEAVNPDGSIVVTEMNYSYRAGQVTRSTIPASAVGNFNYIH